MTKLLTKSKATNWSIIICDSGKTAKQIAEIYIGEELDILGT